jgi:hypothetical protein
MANKNRTKKRADSISLHPLAFEDAVKALLETKPVTTKKKAERKRKKKTKG